jgi:hypothetical protein
VCSLGDLSPAVRTPPNVHLIDHLPPSIPPSAMPALVPLSMAIILFDLVQPLDFIGPCDLLTPLQPSRLAESNSAELTPYSLTISYLAPTLEPITMAGGLQVIPTMTFDEADGKEWDVILVPGGRGARPWLESNARARRWLGTEAGHVEKARWVLTGEFGSLALRSFSIPSKGRKVGAGFETG